MKFEKSEILKNLPKQFFANLVIKVNKKIAEGVDVINLGQGNPDKQTPEYIVKSTQKWVASPQSHKYSLFRGQPDFKQAIADFYQEKYQTIFDPEKEVAVLGGSKTGLVELPLALIRKRARTSDFDPGFGPLSNQNKERLPKAYKTSLTLFSDEDVPHPYLPLQSFLNYVLRKFPMS
ncbi:glutamine-dependent 2-keto-4-methylthiobutyrate transaminase [Ligilactobacillus salivarius NIAS840]|uniref:Glutamine-dependent 2-keto-4-methylthiobutyrate transaminase n=1 Tax=Ligilactobacillus salivarius NIAS840 TaxID=1029822 RepID=F5VGJ7_9LACO|nr:aminotransferase class I/II-fold pyridoxal phosphate-dependent enzyme [Ligilactobacillus salivarius]EGL97998.1 glutamine-dependent 2-keto-4-methylthiobutyrate transaminase [Ligilactobacillus salivarius NIAS840]